MSVAQLKKELTARAVDFSDCIEKSELVSRLASARLASPQAPVSSELPKGIDDPPTLEEMNKVQKSLNQSLKRLQSEYPPDCRLIISFRGLCGSSPMTCITLGNTKFIEIASQLSSRLINDKASVSTNFMNLVFCLGQIATLDEHGQKVRASNPTLLKALSEACGMYLRKEYFRNNDREEFIRTITMLIAGATVADETVVPILRAPHLFKIGTKGAYNPGSCVFGVLFYMNASYEEYGRGLLRKCKPKFFEAIVDFLEIAPLPDNLQQIYLTFSNLYIRTPPPDYPKNMMKILVDRGIGKYLIRDVRALQPEAIGFLMNLIQENGVCEGILSRDLLFALADAADSKMCPHETRDYISGILYNLVGTRSAPQQLASCNAIEPLMRLAACRYQIISEYGEVLLTKVQTLTGDVKVINRKCSLVGCNVRDKNLKKCSRCAAAWYCSQECQKKDWPQHKQVCNKLKENRPSVSKKQATMDRTVAMNFFSSHVVDFTEQAEDQNLTLPQCVVVVNLTQPTKQKTTIYSISEFYSNQINEEPFNQGLEIDLPRLRQSHANSPPGSAFIGIMIQSTSISAFVIPLKPNLGDVLAHLLNQNVR
eukprot:Phypoly_transcript_06057.p1 GENE.Phypoly_transcript_06057~~Phypoly_transcript_06057.p1  ORF type:complete len:614 (+),score=63.59 Phypoly_transcript_06057:59-1843(+)